MHNKNCSLSKNVGASNRSKSLFTDILDYGGTKSLVINDFSELTLSEYGKDEMKCAQELAYNVLSKHMYYSEGGRKHVVYGTNIDAKILIEDCFLLDNISFISLIKYFPKTRPLFDKSKELDIITEFCHDAAEPIRSTANFLQLIKAQLVESENQSLIEYISYAMKSLSSLKSWTSDIIAAENNEAYSTFSIAAVLREIEDLIKFNLTSRLVTIKSTGKLPLVRGNFSQIVRLFKNLVENSIRHAKTENLTINIYKAPKQPCDELFVNIIFKDNGTPQPEQDEDDGRTRLGMLICEKIASNHGGELSLKDTINGYEYLIKLPTVRS